MITRQETTTTRDLWIIPIRGGGRVAIWSDLIISMKEKFDPHNVFSFTEIAYCLPGDQIGLIISSSPVEQIVHDLVSSRFIGS